MKNSESIEPIPAPQRIYQFKVSLIGITPLIWRRIQTRDCALDRLHQYIQVAFDWWTYHLYRFEIDKKTYGDPSLLQDGFNDIECDDALRTRVSRIIPRDGSRLQFLYIYDFGDNWRHEVLFEGCLRARPGERYPLCIEGARACAPEDVGGVRGYYEYIEAMADPSHKQHAEWLGWRGPFDPEKFDAEATTKKMRRGIPKPKEDDGFSF